VLRLRSIRNASKRDTAGAGENRAPAEPKILSQNAMCHTRHALFDGVFGSKLLFLESDFLNQVF
jgi:hypothetical protein